MGWLYDMINATRQDEARIKMFQRLFSYCTLAINRSMYLSDCTKTIIIMFARDRFREYKLSQINLLSMLCSQLSKWNEMKWMVFNPHLCKYRPNWAKKTSCGWWDEWEDTALQTQDSTFDPWRSEAEREKYVYFTKLHGWKTFAKIKNNRFREVTEVPQQYYIFTSEQRRNIFTRVGLEPAIIDFLSRQL